MKSVQILNESLPFLAVRCFAILLVCVANCYRPTFIGNNCRRYGSTLSIHRGAVRRSAAVAARRRRRDQQRAEHGNVAVRSKAVNGRTRTHSLVVLLVRARTLVATADHRCRFDSTFRQIVVSLCAPHNNAIIGSKKT